MPVSGRDKQSSSARLEPGKPLNEEAQNRNVRFSGSYEWITVEAPRGAVSNVQSVTQSLLSHTFMEQQCPAM